MDGRCYLCSAFPIHGPEGGRGDFRFDDRTDFDHHSAAYALAQGESFHFSVDHSFLRERGFHSLPRAAASVHAALSRDHYVRDRSGSKRSGLAHLDVDSTYSDLDEPPRRIPFDDGYYGSAG